MRLRQCGFGNAGDIDPVRRRPRYQISIQRDIDGFDAGVVVAEREPHRPFSGARLPVHFYPCWGRTATMLSIVQCPARLIHRSFCRCFPL